MKSTIKQLYDGEIFPAEQAVAKDSEYVTTSHKISRIREMLKQRLGKEDADKLDDLSNYHYDSSNMECYASFEYGLKLGIMLMNEIYKDGI